jgi:tripartite-type tricarboxylate transporter receptor subunit TctC
LARVEKLAAAFKKMTEDKAVLAMIKQFGEGIHYLGPDEFTKEWREEYGAHKGLGRQFKK